MKIRISATIEKETEALISKLLKKGRYRNKSHVIEEAVVRLVEGSNEKK